MRVIYRVGDRIEEKFTNKIIFSGKWLEFYTSENYRYSVPVDCVICIGTKEDV